MKSISKSPERGTFQQETYKKKLEENPNDENAQSMIELYDQWKRDSDTRELTAEWQKDNMEYDLRTTDWILEKVRADDAYAQNLYAAMCNNGFIKLDVIPILKQEEWSCSWRSAGGIIANMRQEGDYIDWYCSGIRDIGIYSPDDEKVEYTEEQLARKAVVDRYVPEGQITDEIRNDLQRLGWAVAPDGDWKKFV